MAKLKIKKTKKQIKQAPEKPKEENEVVLPAVRSSDEPTSRQAKWINRQRVLVFAARSINHRHRHLMEDLKKLMPHHKTESKMERSKNLYVVNEISEMKNCNKCILFEGRKMRDLYVWFSNIPNGPSAKFLVENIYTMGELKMTGNCLRGSRPLLSFDPQFTKDPHYSLLKELLTQIFGVPKHHPKSQPFFDHVYTFMILDNRIWFRNYQILSEDGALAEIGPRFVLNPTKIFSGSFGGTTLWENPKYSSDSKELLYCLILSVEEIKQEDASMDEEGESEVPAKPRVGKKKSIKRPEKTIRRKQLKAKSKLISDQIKKRKQIKKKKPTKK
ncbi:putative brix domain-containing protein 2 [Danaus plexippus plexippus]|uniref:Ribosome biogenesis protein BRX1 homolog n=1 Tax=Danaus plexippus plexippus TaxID=278856 RepID=A0A212FFE7_DANPL|nr:putative brix domain-containing protein 2 [Danaus plexippus plexippus]